jgi:hypothetical protein
MTGEDCDCPRAVYTPPQNISWNEPRPPLLNSLHVHNSTGSRPATEADLNAAGFVRAISPSPAVDAHREAEAWRKIDRWLLADRKNRTVVVTPGSYSGWFAAASVAGNPFESKLKVGEATDAWDPRSTKTEALEALATWCEGQK